MQTFLDRLPPTLALPLRDLRQTVSWIQRRFAAPAPGIVKRRVLLRNGFPGATWIETGTYRGDTTRFLSSLAEAVISIEADPTLATNARRRLASRKNVRIIEGRSEDVLPTLLPSIEGNVNFWLDGHYSAGMTFRGPSPIELELKSIGASLTRWTAVAVLVDDVRLFSNENIEGYPPLRVLVDWAERTGLWWSIEHDIFVAKSRSREVAGPGS